VEYGITRHVMSFNGFVELSKEEYDTVMSARKTLFEVLFLEQKLDLLLENYLEYEMELLNSAARYMLYRDLSYSSMQDEIYLVARRIVNLLTTCKLYLDQSMHHLNVIFGKSSAQSEAISSELSSQYDAHKSYRLMEALRNYVQHRGLPVHSLSFFSGLEDDQPGGKLVYSIIPFIQVKKLQDDPKFKQSIKDELGKTDEQIDLRPLIRKYVECLCQVHSSIRELLDDDLKKWEETIHGVISKFRREYPDDHSLIGLALTTKSKRGEGSDIEYISEDFIKRINQLRKKNKLFDRLSHRIVTS
jgi:hypothetical protein